MNVARCPSGFNDPDYWVQMSDYFFFKYIFFFYCKMSCNIGKMTIWDNSDSDIQFSINCFTYILLKQDVLLFMASLSYIC